MLNYRIVAILLSLLTSQISAAGVYESIQKHRTGFIVIETSPYASVEVKQLKHEFWFGCAINRRIFSESASAEDRKNFREKFLLHFNCAVTESALKWRQMESEQGQVNFATTDRILAWADEHNLPLRGHNIFWGVPRFVPGWVKELDDEALYQTVRTRARTVAGRYRGRFAEYDLNNEMIHGNLFEERLGPDITRKMAAWIKEIDPNAVLYLNDYDVLTGNVLEKYIKHIRTLLDQGVQIDGIGVQGHLHGASFDPQALKAALDKLSQFNLPIRITEFNMPGQRSRFYKDRKLQLTHAEEEQKAKNLVDYYRICFAHPAVEGILMWGFWRGANWIPASSLYHRDWTPTPAAHAYLDLVRKQWWTDTRVKADSNGLCTVRAFFGTHQVTVNDRKQTVELKKEVGTAKVHLP